MTLTVKLSVNSIQALREALARFQMDAEDLRRCESDPEGRVPHEVALQLAAYDLMCARLQAIIDGREVGPPPPAEQRLA